MLLTPTALAIESDTPEVVLPPEKWERIKDMDAFHVMEGLKRCLTISAEMLVEASMYVKRADELKVDLSELNGPLLAILRRIAHGQCLPGVVVKWSGQPRLRDKIASLPIPDQKRFLEVTEAVEVAITKPDGSLDAVSLPVSSLRSSQVDQVFDRNRIRSIVEQNALVREKLGKQSVPSFSSAYEILYADKTVVFKAGCRLCKKEIETILALLAKRK
jgi:hypothetical protein